MTPGIGAGLSTMRRQAGTRTGSRAGPVVWFFGTGGERFRRQAALHRGLSGAGTAHAGSTAMAYVAAHGGHSARRCTWRLKAGRQCNEPAVALDHIWQRWLCHGHADTMASKQWTALDSAQIATAVAQPSVP